MWDVKKKVKVVRIVGDGFHINYVGCKVYILSRVKEIDRFFHINYVGCKDL